MHPALTFTTVDSRVGKLLLVKRHAGNDTKNANRASLIRVAYLESETEMHKELATLQHQLKEEPTQDDSAFEEEVRQIQEYFVGKRRQFDVKYDLLLSSRFPQEVYEQVRTIPYGQTASYGEIANLAGRPNAYRAAGTACGHNPLVLIIPCHRVIKADGTIGDYGSAGRERKQFLLDLEGMIP